MNKTYETIRKIPTGKGDDFTTGCLLDYHYFKENYKTIAVDLIRQNELDADPREIQQINFTANLDRAGNINWCNKVNVKLSTSQLKVVPIEKTELSNYT